MHDDGDRASAKGAGAAKATLVISSSASLPVNEVAQAATGPVWFQLYVQRDRGFTHDLVQRAEASRVPSALRDGGFADVRRA